MKGDLMQVTVLEIDGIGRYVVRPVDQKALTRFLSRARTWLLRDSPDGTISHRPAVADEIARWQTAHDLHSVWGGDEDEFFGIPL